MTQPENVALDQTTASLVDDAERLGLTWTLRPGTVQLNGNVLLDGDSTSVNVVSLIGALGVNQRVLVLFVAEGGNYVLGSLSPRISSGVYLAASFNFLASTWLVIDWDSFEWSSGVRLMNGQLHVPATGLYSVSAQIVFAGASNTTTRSISFNKNSNGSQATGLIVQSNKGASSTAGDSTAVSLERKVQLEANDYVEIFGFSRSAVAGQPGQTSTWASIVLLN